MNRNYKKLNSNYIKIGKRKLKIGNRYIVTGRYLNKDEYYLMDYIDNFFIFSPILDLYKEVNLTFEESKNYLALKVSKYDIIDIIPNKKFKSKIKKELYE